MASEKRLQKFHTDDVSLPKSGWCFWLVTPREKFDSTNQKHYPDSGSVASSVWNFCSRLSDVISRKNSGSVAKCRLFSQATSSETCHVILSERTKRYMYKPFWCLSSVSIFIFILQIKTVDLSNSADCLSKFKSSKWLGLLLFAGIVGGTVLKESSNSENEERKA